MSATEELGTGEREKWLSSDHDLHTLFDQTADWSPDDGPRAERNLGVPLLVGESGGGKNHLVEDYCKSRRGPNGRPLTLVSVMVGDSSPEDLAGWPYRETVTTPSGERSTTGRLGFTNPSILPYDLLQKVENRYSYVILLDEIEKCSADSLAILLSLLHPNRTLRGNRIHCHSIIACCNQPQRPLGIALTSRCLPIIYPPQDYDYWQRADLRIVEPYLRGITPRIGGENLKSITSSLRSFHRLSAWTRLPLFWKNDHVMEWVINASLEPEHALAALARYRDIPTQPALEWAETAGPADVAGGLTYYLYGIEPELATQVADRLKARAVADATGELALALDAFFLARKPLAALETYPGESSRDKNQRLDDGAKAQLKRFKKLLKDAVMKGESDVL